MRVTWEIDIEDATSAFDAAWRSFLALQRRGTTATVFTVTDKAGQRTTVDLDEALTDPATFQVALARAREATQYFTVASAAGEDRAWRASIPHDDEVAWEKPFEATQRQNRRGIRYFRLAINALEITLRPVGRGGVHR